MVMGPGGFPLGGMPDGGMPDLGMPEAGTFVPYSKLNIVSAENEDTIQAVHLGDEGNSVLVEGNVEVQGNFYGGTVHSDALGMTMEDQHSYMFMMA